MLGLRFCARAFSSCGERGPLFIVVRGPLTVAASLVAEHRLQTRRFSSCSSWAQLLCSTWDLPRPGLEPVSPALAGRFSTTAPPGKPETTNFKFSKNTFLLLLIPFYYYFPRFLGHSSWTAILFASALLCSLSCSTPSHVTKVFPGRHHQI